MNQHALPDAAGAYEAYFASGAYDRRYPRPNRNVLRRIRQHLPAGGHVIDYGCGSGRYLMALGDRAGVAAGFDICEAALERFRWNAGRAGWPGLHALGPEPADVAGHVARHGPADVVLCLFGVLAHIEGRAERLRTLRRLAALMRPGSGRLILSVPNRRRRFRTLQRAQGGEEIRYVRSFAEGSVELSYRLYDARSLEAELAAAGLRLERLTAESLLPEAVIANSRLMRALDRTLTPLTPAALGYGLLAVARRVGE
jgi:SAM-dependent methyltransferase